MATTNFCKIKALPLRGWQQNITVEIGHDGLFTDILNIRQQPRLPQADQSLGFYYQLC